MFKKSLMGTILALTISSVGNVEAIEEPISMTEIKSNHQEELSRNAIYEERIQMLELSIIPRTPRETVDVFAKAVKERNGAVQYALLSDDARKKVYDKLAATHWVTGVSSPWVETYKIISETERKGKKQLEYVVEFNLFTSTGEAGTDQVRLLLEKSGEQWKIKKVEPASKETIGIWLTYDTMDTKQLEKQLSPMKTYNSTQSFSMQFPAEVMKKLKIEEGTCVNEEGNPPCTFFYYKDEKQNKEMLLLALLHLSDRQLKMDYYKEHPFMTYVGKSKNSEIYYVTPSEHPYGESEHSNEGKEWSHLIEVVLERLYHIDL